MGVVTSVRVEFKKTVSDREYGNETVTASYVIDVSEGEDARLQVAAWLAQARADVRSELRQSESINLRRAVNPRPRVCNGCGLPLEDDERSYLHPECEEKMRQERNAERERERAEREAVPAGISADDHDADDRDIPF